MRILLLEDEDSIRGALVRAFERDGHTVRAAASVAEGRARLDGWMPQLAVSDLKLPDGNGLDLVGSLGVPFVMLSGYATYDDAVRALRLGAVDFFTKPVAIKDIRAAIIRAAARIDGAEHPAAGQHLTWSDRPGACVAAVPLLRCLSGRIARLAVAELAQMADCGQLDVRSDAFGVRIWLDATIDPAMQVDRQAWLTAHGVEVLLGGHGVVVRVPPEATSSGDEKSELLWPEELKSGVVIQAGAWTMFGSWFLTAVRAGLGPLSGLAPQLIAACAACGVQLATAPEDLAQPGVGGGERADLLADMDLGAPLA